MRARVSSASSTSEGSKSVFCSSRSSRSPLEASSKSASFEMSKPWEEATAVSSSRVSDSVT
jgi:hypothetical protein